MKTEITTTLQKLVLERMSPQQRPMDDKEIDQWMEWLPEISARMFNAMSKTVFGFLSDKLIERHLSQIRKECTLMLDALHGYPECMGNIQRLHKMALDCLLAILQHLRLNYNKYLDANLAMPKVLYHHAAQKLESNAVVMVTTMTRYHADKRLQALVIGKMTCLLKKESGTWHQVSYLEKLQDSIMRLCVGPVVNITDQLRDLLLLKNFNTSGFLIYCKDRIEAKLAECYEFSEHYNRLFHYQRELITLTDSDKFLGFEPRRPKMKEVLLEYVNSGLLMLNNTHRMFIENKVMVPAGQCCKLPVSISVDVLAYLFRLLMTVGVARGNKTDLLLFISRSFQTPGTGEGEISIKSIDSKYRQVVTNTAIAVRSILLKMLKQLDDDFK